MDETLVRVRTNSRENGTSGLDYGTQLGMARTDGGRPEIAPSIIIRYIIIWYMIFWSIIIWVEVCHG